MRALVSEGDEAPDFELPAHTGETVRLSDLRGRPVVLYFYPRAGTPGCTREAERFNSLLEEFSSLGVEVLGISTDSPRAAARFADRLGLRFRLLSDVDGRVASSYGALKAGTKRPSARRVTFILGSDGRILKILEGVRPAQRHADLALEFVREKLGS